MSRDRYHELYDSAPVGYLTLDRSGNILDANVAAATLLGVERARLIGRTAFSLLEPCHADTLYRHLGEVFDSGGKRGCELLVGSRRQGQERETAIFVESIAFADAGGERSQCRSVLIDLTDLRGAHEAGRHRPERKRAEQTPRESEQQFRIMADSAPVLLWMTDSDGRCTFCNRGWLEFTGRAMEEEAGDGWASGVHPEDYARCMDAYREGFAARRPVHVEYRLRRANGHYAWVLDVGQPRWTDDGTFAGFVGVVADISARRELEEELRQAQKMEAVGALATGVAHDFGNVLQAVLGCVNLARNEEVSRERAIEYLERAACVARRGGKLAGQLMAFAHKHRAEPKPIELDLLVKGSVGLLERLVTEQVAVRFRAGARGAMVVADTVQLEQILLNLAANARDAMPEGGTLLIRTGIVDAEDLRAPCHGLAPALRYARLVVEDSGVGMDEVTRARVFEPFFTTKEVGKGTGLGLSSVFAVTKQLGGHVALESDVGKGTTFIFHFPICRQVTESTRPPPREEARFVGTVLLVEDEPTVRMTVHHYLEELGLEVLEAEDPVAAQHECERHGGTVDLLLSDIVLPVMRGTKLAELLRQRYPGLRVLLTSASPEFLAEGQTTIGDIPVLLKPFGKEELSEQLETLLPRQRREGDALAASAPVPRTASEPTRLREPPPVKPVVLVVEDEAAARDAFAELLESQGYRVVAAATPRQALAVTDGEDRIDVVVSDLRLPQMSGDELARLLLEKHRRAQLIFMSGLPEPVGLGVTFVQKPVDLDVVIRLIEQALSSAQPSPGQ